jgi:hypothetical protein
MAIRDVALDFPRNTRLLLYFSYTTVATWILLLLDLHLGVTLFGVSAVGIAPRPSTGLIASLYLAAVIGAALLTGMLTPLAVIVQRKLLLSEPPPRRMLSCFDVPRGRTFFKAVFSIYLAYFGPVILLSIVDLAVARGDSQMWTAVSPIIAIFVPMICCMIYGVRLAPALPAIAIDSSGPWRANGFALSRDGSWRIFWILAVPAIGIALPAEAAMHLIIVPADSWAHFVPGARSDSMLLRSIWSPAYLVILLIAAVAQTLLVAVWASALSHLYAALTGGTADASPPPRSDPAERPSTP